MYVKIKLNVRKPLKRKNRITRRDGSEFVVLYKYTQKGLLRRMQAYTQVTHKDCARVMIHQSWYTVAQRFHFIRSLKPMPPSYLGKQQSLQATLN